MSKEGNLKKGDVFEVKVGMKVYGKLPYKFIYSSTTENSKDANEIGNHDVEIGDIFKTTKSKIDTGEWAGEYLVVEAKWDGGGTGHGPHDVYPDGWSIVAKKLKDGNYDPEGNEIHFYQSGSFTIMHTDVPVLRHLTPTFV